MECGMNETSPHPDLASGDNPVFTSMASSTIISSEPSPPLTSLSFSLPLPLPLLKLFLWLLGPLAPLTLCLIEHPTPHSKRHTQAPRSTSPYRSMTRRRHVLPRLVQLLQGSWAHLAFHHVESSALSTCFASR